MGFLSWFKKNQKDEEVQGSQLDLFGSSQELSQRKRVDGKTVRSDYTKTIQDKGGDRKALAGATEALTQEVTGHGTKELYDATKAQRGKRETLPNAAQKALVVGETIANFDLQETEIEGNQAQRNAQIVDAAKESGKKVRKWLPW